MRTIPAIPLRLLASVVLGIVLAIPANPPALFAQGTCPGHGAAPTPVEVTVTAVPIVVASTTADYFVLYVKHDVDGGTLEQPVAVVLGEDGTTTLAENVEALAPGRYKVEKYLVADPVDVDGDCTDDISELADPAGMNPVNPAAAIEISSGAVIIPDRATLDTLATDFGGGKHMKFIVFGMNTERIGIYFMNAKLVAHHYLFVNSVGLSDEDTIRGNISYDPELLGPGGGAGLYYFWTTLNRSESEYYSFDFTARVYALLAASMPMVNDNLALYIRNEDVAGYQPHLPVYRQSRIDLRFREDIHGMDSFRILNPGEAVGRLRVLEPDDLPHPRDIVIYGALPNELPRVAGVISAPSPRRRCRTSICALSKTACPTPTSGTRSTILRSTPCAANTSTTSSLATGRGASAPLRQRKWMPTTQRRGPPTPRRRNATSPSRRSPPSATSASRTGRLSESRLPMWPPFADWVSPRGRCPMGSPSPSTSTTSS